ncbi:MAG: hypothetical protein CMK59_00750 [Proteobacteria bacterium]|nr:hypothetical protein [Pseudomonadota bacterium]
MISALSLRKGSVVDGYTVLGEIGRGGMAIIYEAQKENEVVAIKMMHTLNPTPEHIERFHREHSILKKISHPYILNVYHEGTFQDSPYFVMERLRGKVLSESIKEWRQISSSQRFKQARIFLIQIAKALKYIHNQGLVHRDLKLNNLMVLEDGSIRLMDFGVVHTPDTELTQMGAMVGTASYISPEQIQGHEIDARADLYALGIVLYQMLTGEHPFQAKSMAGYLNHHLKTTPDPPHHVSKLVPHKLELAALRLLEKNPDDRFSSARHLLLFLGIKSNDEHAIIGRSKELAVLRKRIVQTPKDEAHLLVIRGPSGIGCTMLLKEAQQFASFHQNKSFFCRNTSSQQPAYSGFQSFFKEIQTQSEHSSDLEQLSMLFEDKRFETVEKWSIYAAIKRLLCTHLDLLMIDNIDQADAGTLELLEYLIRVQAPLFIIVVFHDETPIITQILNSTTYQELQPSALTHSDVEEFLLEFLSHSPQTHSIAQKLLEKTGGNPTLLHHILSTLSNRGTLDEQQVYGAPLPLPQNLKESTSQRWAKLSEEEQLLLAIFAISRNPLTKHQIQKSAILPLSTGEISEALNKLAHENFLEHSKSGFQLLHTWMSTVIQNRLPQSLIVNCHAALAQMLEKTHSLQTNVIIESLAYHCEEGKLYTKAYLYLSAAAEQLKNQTLFEASLDHIERAERLACEAQKHMIYRRFSVSQMILKVLKLEILRIMGRVQEAALLFKENHIEQPDLYPPHILSVFYTELLRHHREQFQLEQAMTAALKALELSRSSEAHIQIPPLYHLGAIYFEQGEFRTARQYFMEALHILSEHHIPKGFALVNNGLGALAMIEGDSVTARRYFNGAIKVCKKSSLIEESINPLTNLAELHLCTGHFSKGLQLINELLPKCKAINFPQGEGVLLRYKSMLLGDLGYTEKAQIAGERAYLLQKKLNNPHEQLSSLFMWLKSTFPLHTESTLLDEALSLAENHDVEGFYPILLCWKAHLLWKQGHKMDLNVTELKISHVPHQRIRCLLSLAHYLNFIEETEQASDLAHQALILANKCRFRFYSYKATLLLSILKPEHSRHKLNAASLGKTLKAALSSEEQHHFMLRNQASFHE